MRHSTAFIIIASILSGCVSRTVSDLATVGEYEMGGFNETTSLDLKADHSYRISQILIYCMLDENGNLPVAQDEEKGTWSFRDGVVTLKTTAVPPRDYYCWFARMKLEYRRSGKVLVSDVQSAPVYGRQCFSEKKKMPNQALEPTTLRVMPSADAEVTPRKVVAHLER